MSVNINDNNKRKIDYHLEFQTRNDTTMSIRMFEYGFSKGKETSKGKNELLEIEFPKQKVIFIEKNRNIPDILQLKINLDKNESITYKVPVIKYWEYSCEELVENKMYSLLPLQLFLLRKDMEIAVNKKNYKKLHTLAMKSRDIEVVIFKIRFEVP